MKKVVTFLAAVLASASLHAADTYNFYVMNAAGSSSDMLARKIAEVFETRTKKKLVVVNLPGGDQIPAATAFKRDNKISVSMGGTGMHIYNYILHKDLPYSDSDFRFVTFFDVVALYTTTTTSQITDINKFLDHIAATKDPLLGTYDASTKFNALVLARNKNQSLTIVPYKGSIALNTALAVNEVSMGLTSAHPDVFRYQQEGKVRIIAHTGDRDLVLSGVKVPSLSRHSDVPQFSGGVMISITPGTSPEHEELARALKETIDTAEVTAQSEKFFLVKSDVAPHSLREEIKKRRDAVAARRDLLVD